jgi:plasmid stabilization system protein ParE
LAKHRSVDQAARWLSEIETAIQDLSTKADHHPLARESPEFQFEVRQMNFGLAGSRTHRVLFSVQENRILVYAVRHLAQQDLPADDLE